MYRNCPAELEIDCPGVHRWLALLADTNVNRAIGIQSCVQRPAQFRYVTRRDDSHAWKGSQYCKILKRVVSCSKLRIGQPRSGSDNDDRGVVITGIHTDLLEATRRRKGRDRVNDRSQAA